MVISVCFLCRTFCELWQPSSNHCGFSRSFEQALQPLLGCVPAAWKWSAELTKAPLALPTSAQSRPHQKRYRRCSSGRRGQTPCCVTSDGDVCTALRVKSIHDTLEVCTLFHFPGCGSSAMKENRQGNSENKIRKFNLTLPNSGLLFAVVPGPAGGWHGSCWLMPVLCWTLEYVTVTFVQDWF